MAYNLYRYIDLNWEHSERNGSEVESIHFYTVLKF